MASRIRFSLKSLVVVVSFVAVLFGWWSDHWRLRQRIEELEELEQYDAAVMQKTIQSGVMVDPISPPGGVNQFRADDVERPEQADMNAEMPK